MDQNTQEKNFRAKSEFLKKLFSFSPLKLFFFTNIESNAAVTLHFEDLAVENNLFCVHLLVKNLKLFKKALLMSVKFFFLNILMTTHDRVRESVKNALSCTLLHLVFNIFKKKNFTIIKSAFLNHLRFFTNKCTHLLKTSNSGPQGSQNAALQQRYSPG